MANGFKLTDFDKADALRHQLKNVRAQRDYLEYCTTAHDISAVTVFVISHDTALMDISTDIEGSPFVVDEFLEFCRDMLVTKEQALIEQLAELGVLVNTLRPPATLEPGTFTFVKPDSPDRAA